MIEWLNNKMRDGAVQVSAVFLLIAFIAVWLENGINITLEYSALLFALLTPPLISIYILTLIRTRFFNHFTDTKQPPPTILALTILLLIVVHLMVLSKVQSNFMIIYNLVMICPIWIYIIVKSRKKYS